MNKTLYFKLMSLIFFLLFSTYLFINFFILQTFKDQIVRQVPKSAVDTAYSIMESIAKDYNEKKLPEAEAKKLVKDIVKNLRLDDGSYFWIHNMDLKMVLHPIKPEMNETDLSTYKSPDNHFLFKEMNEVLSKSANGKDWYNYYWPKPNESTDQEKTSYLRLYKPWGWVIGSGMYVGDIEALLFPFFMKIQIIISVLFGGGLFLAHLIARAISRRLQNVSTEVHQTADDFNVMASETQKAIDALVQVSVQQSSAIEETAASVHQINAMSEQNYKHSEEAIQFSETNRGISLNGKKALLNLETSIEELEKSIEKMTQEIENNNHKFEDINLIIGEISSKTKIINDIVFQTKLLSFNASVEAARAGENGKGFAVVAEEIGKLANVSGNASKEINELISKSSDRISNILRNSKEIVADLNIETKNNMDKGRVTNKEFSEIFDQMIENIEKITNRIKDMSLASKEQVEGITQINTALSQLTDTGHHGMNATDEIKTQIETLTRDAKLLETNVKILNKEVKGE